METISKLYTTIQQVLFPMLKEEIGELTEKQEFFAAVIEMIKPSRFITQELCWSGLGRPMKEREYVLRSFILKAIYNFPTTKALIENLKTNPTLRRLCGWEYGSKIPSGATFSRIFKVLAETQLLQEI